MNFREFVFYWNSLCPVDRWWREKYKVPFNSSRHRAMSFIDMCIEFTEDEVCKEIENEYRQYLVNTLETPYIPGKTSFLKERRASQEDIDQAYEDLDIEKIE